MAVTGIVASVLARSSVVLCSAWVLAPCSPRLTPHRPRSYTRRRRPSITRQPTPMRPTDTLPRRRRPITLPTKHLELIRWQTAALLSIFAIAAAGCSVQTRSTQHYAGTLHASVPNCPPTDATLVVQDGRVVFSPSNATWILTGSVSQGRIEASANRPSFDHKTYATMLKATVTEAAVKGSYMTPSCKYDVDLASY